MDLEDLKKEIEQQIEEAKAEGKKDFALTEKTSYRFAYLPAEDRIDIVSHFEKQGSRLELRDIDYGIGLCPMLVCFFSNENAKEAVSANR